MARDLALWGIAINTIGVVMLFFFGMPFVVPRKGASYWMLEGPDLDALKKERLYSKLGWAALCLLIVGAALQFAAVWLTS